MLTQASTTCLVVVMMLSIGCSDRAAGVAGSPAEAPDDASAELQEPRVPRAAFVVPPDELPPINETFVLDLSCDEVAEWLGAPLPHLPTLPAGTEEAICAVENPHGPVLPERDQSRMPAEHRYSYVVHVLYVPRLDNVSGLSYKQLIQQGAIDVGMQFNVPVATLPSEGDPNEIAGGFTVESVRGNRAIVQRLADRQSWVMWFEDTEAGPGRHVVVGQRSPGQIFGMAQALRRGRPPQERDAAE